jgi:hypothetical protein
MISPDEYFDLGRALCTVTAIGSDMPHLQFML